MALGELELRPAEFWTLTNGELIAMIRGFVVRRDLRSSDIRNLFTLTANINRKEKTAAKRPHEVWELDIDSVEVMDIETRLDLYSKIAANSKFNTQ